MMKLWLIIFDISSQVSNGFAIVSAPNSVTAQQILMTQGSQNQRYNIIGIKEIEVSRNCQTKILTEGITSRGEKGDPGVREITDDFYITTEGKLAINKTAEAKKDSTKPITSGGVYTIVGNIDSLLQTV